MPNHKAQELPFIAEATNSLNLSDQQRAETVERFKSSEHIEKLRALLDQHLASHSFEFLLGELTSHAAAIASQRISSALRNNKSAAITKAENSLINQQSFDLMRDHYNTILRRVPDLEANLRQYLVDEFILIELLECERKFGSDILELPPAQLASKISSIFLDLTDLGFLQIITEALNMPADTLAHAPMKIIDPDKELFAPVRSILDPIGTSAEEEAATGRKKRAEELQFLFGPNSGEDVMFSMRTLPLKDNLSVLNTNSYHHVRETLVKKNSFQRIPGFHWPISMLFGSKEGGEYAEYMPTGMEDPLTVSQTPLNKIQELSDKMHAQIAELDDLDADVLDLLSHFWLRKAEEKNTEETDATVSIDELLEKRGLMPKLSGQKRRGGYSQNQRDAIHRALGHIQNLWLSIAEVNFHQSGKKGGGRPQIIQSRAFIVTDRVGQPSLDGELDVKGIVFRPGKNFARYLFGPGRQTALLSIKALSYDPKRRAPEKRLTRYLSWQWRIRAKSGKYLDPYRIQTILDAVDEKIDSTTRNKARIRERIEKALDLLKDDGVIANWQYQKELSGNDWVHSLVVIEPPADFVNYYSKIGKNSRQALSPGKKISAGQAAIDKLVGEISRIRELSKKSVIETAEDIGIREQLLLALENRTIEADELKRIRPKVEKWVKQQSA